MSGKESSEVVQGDEKKFRKDERQATQLPPVETHKSVQIGKSDALLSGRKSVDRKPTATPSQFLLEGQSPGADKNQVVLPSVEDAVIKSKSEGERRFLSHQREKRAEKTQQHDQSNKAAGCETGLDREDVITTADVEFRNKWLSTQRSFQIEEPGEKKLQKIYSTNSSKYLERKEERWRQDEKRFEESKKRSELIIRNIKSVTSAQDERVTTAKQPSGRLKDGPPDLAGKNHTDHSQSINQSPENKLADANNELGITDNSLTKAGAVTNRNIESVVQVIANIDNVLTFVNKCREKIDNVSLGDTTKQHAAELHQELCQLNHETVSVEQVYMKLMKELDGTSPESLGDEEAHETVAEDAQWDEYFESGLKEYLSLKALLHGALNQMDSFDRKVFIFNTDQGKCPVSWRELYSMARLKLKELVCYPYATDEQVKLLMKMENENIYTAWQAEVIEKIRNKLTYIKQNLMETAKGAGYARFKVAAKQVTREQRLKRNSGQKKEGNKKMSAVLKVIPDPGNEKDDLCHGRNIGMSSLLKDDNAFKNSLKKVKNKNYLEKKLKLLQDQRLLMHEMMSVNRVSAQQMKKPELPPPPISEKENLAKRTTRKKKDYICSSSHARNHKQRRDTSFNIHPLESLSKLLSSPHTSK